MSDKNSTNQNSSEQPSTGSEKQEKNEKPKPLEFKKTFVRRNDSADS